MVLRIWETLLMDKKVTIPFIKQINLHGILLDYPGIILKTENSNEVKYITEFLPDLHILPAERSFIVSLISVASSKFRSWAARRISVVKFFTSLFFSIGVIESIFR